MDDNYAALIVSILTNAKPEKAFSLVGMPTQIHFAQDSRIMARYRTDGYSTAAIAHWYGMKPQAVEKRIRRYKAKLAR